MARRLYAESHSEAAAAVGLGAAPDPRVVAGLAPDFEASVCYRLWNVAAALVLFAVSWPLLVLGIATVWVRSGRPLFFRQVRTGYRGRLFRMWKLRTMIRDAEPEGRAVWAAERDPRVIGGGLFLRKYRIDELPQVWNVLRGDMNLVGPRPERPELFPALSGQIANYFERCLARPGLTGLAQVKCGYASCTDTIRQKHTFDLFYIKHRSYALDLSILLRTVRVVLTGLGAR